MRQHKFTMLVCIFTSILWSVLPVQSARAERAIDVANRAGYNLDERYQPAGSIITEINTGQILWQENTQISWAPASMTKLMTILLAYDAMAEGKFNLDTRVDVTEKYLDISGRYALSNNVMKPGGSYSISELIELIIVPSSAAATYMLADQVEPDPDKFAELMNQRAKTLGMTQTTYYNCVGIPNNLLVPYQPVNQSLESNNITSPTDYALLCCYFVKTYPDILNHTKNPKIVIQPGTIYEESFDTYQISLEGAKYGLVGTDGLKTGSSGEAGFNYSSTAKRGDTRLVEIVMGVSSWEDQAGEEMRHLVGNAIMEEAFAKYEYREVLPKGTHTIEGKEIITETEFWDCVPKGQEIPIILKDGKVKVNLERSYLPGYQAPEVTYRLATEIKPMEDVKKTKSDDTKPGSFSKKTIIKGIIGIVVVLLLIMIGIGCYSHYKKEQMRKRRRERRRKMQKRIR